MTTFFSYLNTFLYYQAVIMTVIATLILIAISIYAAKKAKKKKTKFIDELKEFIIPDEDQLNGKLF